MMIRVLETDHLAEQLAALDWLKKQRFVAPNRIATAGNSFGGIEAIVGAERVAYRAAIDCSGGAQSWALSPELQRLWCAQFGTRTRSDLFMISRQLDLSSPPCRPLARARI
jgi:dienelactone hydrolase